MDQKGHGEKQGQMYVIITVTLSVHESYTPHVPQRTKSKTPNFILILNEANLAH